ncbi:MAG: Hsp70 family protein, partial [Betaproteobacteria bacterium]|nr:Hsp70 family protein [Betaproteobacteria bacterium]
MMHLMRRMMATDMAIDLGTANTIIYVQRQGIVLNEPSVVAVDMRGNQPQIIEVGQGAKQMLGRAPGNIKVVRPMKDGVIADYRITEQMLNHFIKKVHGARFLTPGPRIVICVPTSSTPVDRRAIRESALAAGATKVHLIEEPMAAALGCDLPVQEPVGSMVLDIGGGTAE